MGGVRKRAGLLVAVLVMVMSCGACAGCPRWVEAGASAMGRTAKRMGLEPSSEPLHISQGQGTEPTMKLRGGRGSTRCQWAGGCRWHTHPSRRGILF